MYAIVETGGKQYRVSEGEIIRVERLKADAGESVMLDKVLIIGSEAETLVGSPYLDGAFIEAEVLENGKGKKVIIFKYKAKKRYRKKQGHRQPYTELEIKKIAKSGGKSEKKAEKPAASAKAKAESEKPQAAPVTEVNLNVMTKAELAEFAETKGIEVSMRLKKDEMIAAIEETLNE